MSRHERNRSRLAIVVFALLGLLAAVVPAGLWWMASRSSASFADAEVLETNHLGAGTLNLTVGTDSALLEASNLAPGDEVSGQLELTNAGSLPLRFSVTARTGGGLLTDWLAFDLWQSSKTCELSSITSALVTDVKLLTTDTTLVGLGADSIALAVGQSTVLCLGATLDLTAPNDVQGQRLDIDLIVDARHDLEVEQ